MDPALYHRFFEVEDTYWWSVWVRGMVRDWLPPGLPERRILDLGCGTGVLSQDLRDDGVLVSLDYATEALHYCRKRAIPHPLRGDGHALPLADAAFDLVIALDTIEHIRDDGRALREMRRVVKPGGVIIINVPALQLLWSSHDVVNHHFRRYNRRQLRTVIEQAGFRITKLTYTNMLLFLPTLCLRLGKRLLGNADTPNHEILELHPAVNGALIRLMGLERRLVRAVNLPVGTSLFAVAVPDGAGPPP